MCKYFSEYSRYPRFYYCLNATLCLMWDLCICMCALVFVGVKLSQILDLNVLYFAVGHVLLSHKSLI